ncbi:g11063 [Coccomyxa elongata]
MTFWKNLVCLAAAKKRQRQYISSDGKEHLGSALSHVQNRPFPGPPPDEGPPLRVLPIGGLGEIGMNCMLVGVGDRYILIDAGLMFPDFTDLGMQKILPDTSFLHRWRDKIEAVIITHGHEDHIGAMPWVVPALDPETPIYSGGFAMQLIKRRMQEYSIWNESRFKTFKMGERFQLGPFECEPIRVTHSIPDCCGMILRSEHGNIVHTGDWKIDEDPIDGDHFDRTTFEAVSKEGVALFMSDSTNVLSPGRTLSETTVRDALIKRVMGHQGKGRIITTQFASNLHRLASVKAAADAAGRKICFIGMSLTTYLEAAQREGRAPIDPKDLVSQEDMEGMDPNQLLIVTTGSQAEPRAALSLASRGASPLLRLDPSDLILYSAKVIPGNDTRVIEMMNNISRLGPEIAMSRSDNLHTSGHAYRDELEEVMKLVKPQHFLPVHGEYAFLCAHAQLAKDIGIRETSVIRNGQYLGVSPRRNGKTVSSGSMQLLGEAKLQMFYNDGGRGTGTSEEMALEERTTISTEGCVIADVAVMRPPQTAAQAAAAEGQASTSGRGVPRRGTVEAEIADVPQRLHARVRVKTLAMWTDQGRLGQELCRAAEAAVMRLGPDASLLAVERVVEEGLVRECRAYNQRKPLITVIAHEMNSRAAPAAYAEAIQRASARMAQSEGTTRRGGSRRGGGSSRGRGNSSMGGGPGLATPLPKELVQRRKQANPRETPGETDEPTEYP